MSADVASGNGQHREGCIDLEHDPDETPCLDAEDVRYLQAVARDPEGAERWS